MTIQTRLDHQEKIKDMWCKLHGSWSTVDDHERPMWSKKCDAFDIYIEMFDVNSWEFQIITGDGHLLHSQSMKSTSMVDAQEEGDQLMLMFLVRAVEVLGKTTIDLTVPAGEVRFKQLIEVGGKLYGLSDEGVVYTWTYPKKGGMPAWSPCYMTKATASKVSPDI